MNSLKVLVISAAIAAGSNAMAETVSVPFFNHPVKADGLQVTYDMNQLTNAGTGGKQQKVVCAFMNLQGSAFTYVSPGGVKMGSEPFSVNNKQIVLTNKGPMLNSMTLSQIAVTSKGVIDLNGPVQPRSYASCSYATEDTVAQ